MSECHRTANCPLYSWNDYVIHEQKELYVINSHWEPSLPNAPGKDKIWEEESLATMVIAAGRSEGRQANDWRTFNEKRIKQAKAGLFIQDLCETEHQGDYERAGILSLNPEEIWGVCTRLPQ